MEYTAEERRLIEGMKMTIIDKLIEAKCPASELPKVGEELFRWFTEAPTKLVNGQPEKIII